MNTLTIRRDKAADASCPYSDMIAEICSASISSMKLGLKASLNYCSSEGYDGCPIFLANILRNGQLKLTENPECF